MISWPLGARAQQSASGYGAWRNRARRCERCSHWDISAGASGSGWTIGRNVHLDIRWTTPNATKIRQQAAELVALAPDSRANRLRCGSGPAVAFCGETLIRRSIAPGL
jgi:hypothetical protein